ncbi:hypothetical protein CEQ30_10450 [Nocardia brasiliensis]|nr:hypothetical protein CEQ30_10450 [Nocardia brasiliensis]
MVRMDATLIGIILGLTYITAGIIVCKIYYRKRHGVPLKVINGGPALFFTPAYYLAWVWPLAFVLPTLKDPTPCTHVAHIEARARINAAAEMYEAERRHR